MKSHQVKNINKEPEIIFLNFRFKDTNRLTVKEW